ncbi:thioredoxin [Alkalibaculum sp. M08DMB]|uniref:Thioredoxin n=1 Tax=Alkalibaculum sporogenes TaxID=2655001 RepID=A0A6A7K5M4_9FIRM|nr:thioredoxin family protein [Alkalibaculum sporogenes]MPW24443.1 thioredoxin [Alkalibaculum sporogenes]
MDNNRMKVFKIVIPIFIVIAVVGIYFAKNIDNSTTITKDNPDFELHVTDEIDLEHLKSYGLPIMIDFGADECAPCKAMAPVLEKLNSDLQGKAIIVFVDVWKYPEFAQGYPVTLIPTQIFFDNEGNPYKPEKNNLLEQQMKLYTSKDTNQHTFTVHEGGMTEEMILDVLKNMGLKE